MFNIDVCKYFAHLMKKALTSFKSFFLLRGSNDVTVPGILLDHCSNKFTIKIYQDIKDLKIST